MEEVRVYIYINTQEAHTQMYTRNYTRINFSFNIILNIFIKIRSTKVVIQLKKIVCIHLLFKITILHDDDVLNDHVQVSPIQGFYQRNHLA